MKYIFTDEIEFNVFDETQIVSKTEEVIAFVGGITTFKVEVVTPGTSPDVPIKFQ